MSRCSKCGRTWVMSGVQCGCESEPPVAGSATGYARFHVHTTKLRGEPRVWWVHDGAANKWSYPNSEIVFGPCSRSKAEKECARLNAHNDKLTDAGTKTP